MSSFVIIGIVAVAVVFLIWAISHGVRLRASSFGLQQAVDPIQPRECDLDALLRDFERRVLPFLGKHSIEFISCVGRDVPKAFVDPDSLIQVLSNIVGNTIKHGRPHAVVTVSVQADNGKIQFRVKDSGPGIPASKLLRVFDENSQRHDAGAHSGLCLSRVLVETNGGRIWIESAVGRGTTVYFTVPPARRQYE